MTTKKIPQTPGSAYDSDYGSFVQNLDLIGLALKNCRCELDRGAFFAQNDNIKMFSHEYTLTHLGEKTFDAEGHFELAITESEEKAPAVRMDCVFETHFHSKNPIRPDDAERFVGSELKLILVPHARQFFFALSGQMAIPPVVVPLTTRANASRRKKKVRVPA